MLPWYSSSGCEGSASHSGVVRSETQECVCRSLFGDEMESLTTLNAWQNMCEEARHFGRALFDAEEVVLTAMRVPHA